jgi:hypothetical protein
MVVYVQQEITVMVVKNEVVNTDAQDTGFPGGPQRCGLFLYLFLGDDEF